ncbi:hypothetical protein C8A03DRAFT_36342 [Achaetomium macrosporum]|uniref:Myb/SANT-like domain-containing protein n=1 Tax=Achaetomium macrosporum TaxID=79813 RepID=A0AAN7C686_9PEZI|nr:hypothetical protein C8A03DRAFT_36342 [Achaetomium macrosporum]
MEVLAGADDDVDDIHDAQIRDDEGPVNLAGVANDGYNPAIPWQENEGIGTSLDDDDDLFYMTSRPSRTNPSTTRSTPSTQSTQPSQPSQSTDDITTPSPSTRKRRRQKSLAQRIKRKRNDDSSLFTKLIFSREMTARIMELFLDETRAGALKDTKASLQKPAMERILRRLQSEYPRHPWELDKVREKYKNERRRYRLLLTLLAISGVSYSDESGLPRAPDNVWDTFLAKYPKGSWLRTSSIGNREVYAEVYHQEKATGRHIKEARLLVGQGQVASDVDFDVNFSTVEDSSGDTDLEDPDDNSDIDNDIAVVASPRRSVPRGAGRSSRRSRDTGITAVADSIGRLAESNVIASTRVVPELTGAEDIRLAIKDFQEDFASTMAPSSMAKVINKLATPTWALVWNNLSKEMKVEYSKQWASE